MILLRSITLELQGATVRHRTLAWAFAIVGFAAASALAAHVRIHIPFSPVPVTMQTFVVLLAGVTLGSRAGAASQALYLGLCACGLPVFAGGPSLLTAATAGYLVAFPIAAWIAGWTRDGSQLVRIGGLLAATLTIYALGSGWLALVTHQSFASALMLGVVPFIAGDALKLSGVWLLGGLGRKAWEKVSA